MNTVKTNFFLCLISLAAFAQEIPKSKLKIVAESQFQWTGIAISKTNRVFVNFPRWSKENPMAVAEIIDGKSIPYPNVKWNTYDKKGSNQFICVQSMWIDKQNQLWVLDTGYVLEEDKTNAATLYVFDLLQNKLKTSYTIPAESITARSYLNDFRVDEKHHKVYFTDSRLGGLVIFDLMTQTTKRILSNHFSTLAELPQIVVEGYERKRAVHSDGIELDKNQKYLYYCALTGENVYRIPVKAILDENNDDTALGLKVEKFAKTGPNDGILFDKKGTLYLSSLEKNAISIADKKGKCKMLIADALIQWPDSFALNKEGNVFFTTSQIHLPKDKRGTYKIMKLASTLK
ncbi:L-dopachrome tautomerase-related protein [Flavobacterium sp. GCM10023249]|uniref:L-dopachrome tautomerase-related protein n=1 Tax=unclassified Flavobacterium TaxID=196869 RepID=UPI00361ECCCF